MKNLVNQAIESVNNSELSFCKFISANDAGKTGGHQEGFYIPKNSIPLIFDSPGIKGENKERFITIRWQSDFETESRFIYYGQGTRNEYRLTRFGRGFPLLNEESVGDLFILSKFSGDYYEGFVLQSDDEIEEFFAAFNLSSTETNRLINKSNVVSAESKLINCFNEYLSSVKKDFPTSVELASKARNCFNYSFGVQDFQIKANPDQFLLHWIDTEYQLFKVFENSRYQARINTPFTTVEELVNCANTILNRRKSRAGKSLEHHLAEVFTKSSLQYESQVVTEDNKRPDFIFPDSNCYRDIKFNTDKLIFLASKTTCKDRWRQILNEADRIPEKHLFTLQQGISANQLVEMNNYNVKLVVPSAYLTTFPKEHRHSILTLESFVSFVRSKQN